MTMMQIISKALNKKCGGCNWDKDIFYSFNLPKLIKNKSKWLCANCFMDMLVENKAQIKDEVQKND